MILKVGKLKKTAKYQAVVKSEMPGIMRKKPKMPTKQSRFYRQSDPNILKGEILLCPWEEVSE